MTHQDRKAKSPGLFHPATDNIEDLVAGHRVQILELVVRVLHVRDVQLAHFCALNLCIAPGLPLITIVRLRAIAPPPVDIVEALVVVVTIVQHCHTPTPDGQVARSRCMVRRPCQQG